MRTTPIAAIIVIGALALTASADAPHGKIQPTLQKLEDHRAQDFTGEEQSNFGFNRTGLTLTFDLPLDAGFRFASFDEKTMTITATDSSGADLTAVKDGFMGQKDFVEEVSTWHDDGPVVEEFKIKLANPGRSATRFSLRANVPTQVFASVETVEVEVGSALTPLPDYVFGANVKAKLGVENKQATVTLTPGTLKDTIEQAVLVLPDGTEVKQYSSMWNDASLTYYFESQAPEGSKVRFSIRRGFHTVPMLIELTDLPLP